MPYRRSLSRFSKRSWEEFGDEVHRARNEHLMEGIVAGCALVAYADGWVTEQEHLRMLGLIRGFEPIAAFGLDDVTATFKSLTKRFASDQKGGERAALEAVARVKGASPYPTLLVEACCAIAAADGGFDAEERTAAIRICKVLGLDPADFGLAEAR
jgi:tellurite resistance protein TerB